jgi:hypothetical protein
LELLGASQSAATSEAKAKQKLPMDAMVEPGRTVNGEGSLKLFEPNRSMVGVDWKTGFEKVLHFSTANPLRMNLSSLALGLQIPKVTNLIENFIICISPAYFFILRYTRWMLH